MAVAAGDAGGIEPGDTFRLLAALAVAFVRPLTLLSATALAAAAPDGRDLTPLATLSPFRGPLNRAVAKRLDLRSTPIDPAFVTRLEQRPGTRLCALLASQPEPVIGDAGLQVAAAVLHKRVVGLVMKADRDRLRSILGESAFRVATDESALLHAPLIASRPHPGAHDLIEDLADADAARARIVAFGLRVLTGFVALVEPALAGIFESRVVQAGTIQMHAAVALSQEQCEHIVKLLRRRIPAWTAIIG